MEVMTHKAPPPNPRRVFGLLPRNWDGGEEKRPRQSLQGGRRLTCASLPPSPQQPTKGFPLLSSLHNQHSSFSVSGDRWPLIGKAGGGNPNRCEAAFVGNTIGQANGVYDKVLDLRFCDFTNDKNNLKGKTLSAALMSGAKFDGADLTEVVMSKAYAVGASFKGTNFTNAVIDRANFGKADLEGAIFKNTVLSGSTFDEANMKDVDFEDTLIGYIDLQKLCRNTSINEDTRLELGCR
uniref:Thylakoid lumenal 17.4 kDa protein, chloroplastic n=1 Tax=Aegilops tauschii TaxID=37682 RepID=M8BDP7_AEGTA